LFRLYFTGDGMADVKALPKNTRNSLKKLLIQRLASDPLVFKVYEELGAIAIVGVGERQPQSASNIHRRLERLAAQGKLAESVLATLRGLSSRQAGAGPEWTSAL